MFCTKIFRLLMLGFFLTFTAQADLDPDDYTYFTSSNNVCLQELYGQPAAGVILKMDVWVGEQVGGDVEYHLSTVYGTTNSSGYCYLVVGILNSEWDFLDEIRVTVASQNYTVLQEIGSYSEYSHTIYPRFAVVVDVDQNGVNDSWELFLAQKFCPTLKLHHASEWIAPEPVEYIGVAKQDLWFTLYVYATNQYVGEYKITDEGSFVPPIRNWHPWMASSNPNYSSLTGTYFDYVGQPPGKVYATYRLRFHFNYTNNGSDITTPGQWISCYQVERQQNQFPHTVYAHLFTMDNEIVIQYWFFYPYNDGYNNHEGDWEHINVRLNGQNPASAAIMHIDYYFHHKVRTLASGYQVESGTHPVVYVGGSCAGLCCGFSCGSGNTTGGSSPSTGTWHDIGPSGYDEYVNGSGPTISFNSINPVIIPNPDRIDYDSHPEMSWLKVSIRWGNLEVGSPWDWIEPFLAPLPDRWVEPEVGNNAPPGPTLNDGWNRVGSTDDYQNY